jgi:hypothetical protein
VGGSTSHALTWPLIHLGSEMNVLFQESPVSLNWLMWSGYNPDIKCNMFLCILGLLRCKGFCLLNHTQIHCSINMIKF